MIQINERKDKKLRWFEYMADRDIVFKGVAEKGDKNYGVVVYCNKHKEFLGSFKLPRKTVERKAMIRKEL